MRKKALVIHSGGMDSSICLAHAIKKYGKENVLSLSFSYQQRHSAELIQAKKICADWQVDHTVINIDALQEITENALISKETPIEHLQDSVPNTLVVGRNGLMARLGAIHAEHLGANCIYMGVIEVEECNSGYRDCSRCYMDLMQQILRIDLGSDTFDICTPLVKMTKLETLELALELGVLDYLLRETITCYEGLKGSGCTKCPACVLKNEGVRLFYKKYPQLIPVSL